MTQAKGIHASPLFKLGKAPAQERADTPRLRDLLQVTLPTLPPAYDFDTTHPGIPTPMFGNDTYGDCVIAGRAHQTLRFEDLEQGSVVAITDADVTKEYFKQTGGPDVGLVVSTSLELWRTRGWKAAGHNYRIRGYALVDFRDPDQIRTGIYSDVGMGIGVQLPSDARIQIHAGQVWDLTTGPGAQPGSWGGHYVYLVGYTPDGPVCVTWGRKQQMTWRWLAAYCDESYAIFDARNRFRKNIIDEGKLDQAFKTLEAASA